MVRLALPYRSTSVPRCTFSWLSSQLCSRSSRMVAGALETYVRWSRWGAAETPGIWQCSTHGYVLVCLEGSEPGENGEENVAVVDE
jgi:hypothetical protein